ncbi:MAG: hypothetical protein ABIK12_01590 [Pseudomonadota bacterium]
MDKFNQMGCQASAKALSGMLMAIYVSPAIPTDKYSAIKAPTLIMVATRDRLGTFERAVNINEGIANSKITVMEYCGHTSMWERP